MRKSRLAFVLPISLAIALLFGFFVSAFAQQLEIEDIMKRGVLKVGIGAQVPGFCLRNPEGKIEGLDADISKLLAKAVLGDENKLELVPITGAGRIPAVVTRQVDVVICNMTITPERALKAAFTLPYIESGQLVLLRKDVKAQKLEDLNKEGIKIAVFNAQFYIDIAKKYFPKAERLVFEGPGDCLLAVRSGRAHAMVQEYGACKILVRDDPTLMLFDTMVSTPQNVGMLVNRDDTHWMYFLNTFIRELRAGVLFDDYRASVKKWFGDEPAPFK